jgi:hypothetical protein
LIHPQIVAYAAHCGTNYPSIRFGDKISGGGGFSVATSHCRKYPGYTGTGKGNDFAYCKLAQPVANYPIVAPAMGCETDMLEPGQAVTLVGFGNADNGPYGVKRQVVTQINQITSKNEAFIGGGGEDTCQGDSGGPAFVQLGDGSWRVFGITSYGGTCGTGGYYSLMHLGVPWFESDSGIDVTPCTDESGTWNPGPDARASRCSRRKAAVLGRPAARVRCRARDRHAARPSEATATKARARVARPTPTRARACAEPRQRAAVGATISARSTATAAATCSPSASRRRAAMDRAAARR